ncbi:hypothetical protein DL93DRAFT_2080373 [Clavulina sp. PMI_390]|nr:hypothetical protein DL93DRAFT_2080373 [Clavulina sp. PMI_390]
MSSFRLMPSVEILRLPPQDPRELSISLFTLLNSETAITSNDPPQQSPARLFPSLRKLYCQKIYPAVDNRHFKKVDRELDDRLVQLLRQRPLLSIIVAAPIMTPSRMEDIAPGLGGRVFNSDTESEAVVW